MRGRGLYDGDDYVDGGRAVIIIIITIIIM